MKRHTLTLLWTLAFSACANGVQPEEATDEAAEPAAPAKAQAEQYGGELDPGVPFVELADIQAEPKPLLGRPLRTAGQVERVCKKRGCWLELASAGQSPLRVPMAGHAFFIPQEAVGHRAEIQGTLTALPLPEAHRAHVQAEGATALGPLALEATAVRVLPQQ